MSYTPEEIITCLPISCIDTQDNDIDMDVLQTSMIINTKCIDIHDSSFWMKHSNKYIILFVTGLFYEHKSVSYKRFIHWLLYSSTHQTSCLQWYVVFYSIKYI